MNMLRNKTREPNFANLVSVLKKETPPRPVLFEFIIGEEKTKLLAGEHYNAETEFSRVVSNIKAFENGGYDFAPIIVRGMEFPRRTGDHPTAQTKSLNEEALITDRESFDRYVWPRVENADFSIIARAGKHLHPGAKFIVFSHDGILENAIGVVGFDNLCYLLYDDPELAEEIFNNIGRIIYEYFLKCLEYDEIGAIICNDDWGFHSATMLSPAHLRKYVFPWYKKIVRAAHDSGRPAILHSCGYYHDIIDDIIYDMKFDGRHSYEDKIVPVEKAYAELRGKIAVIGGIDVDFLSRATPGEVYNRSRRLLEMTAATGGFALGSGNSIPDFIPDENYLAMLRAALDME